MNVEWLPIHYREFYDVPRIFVVAVGESALLFDSPFDDDADEYSPDYRVYRLNGHEAVPELGPWDDLAGEGTLIGTIPTGEVVFDETRRAAIHRSVVESLT